MIRLIRLSAVILIAILALAWGIAWLPDLYAALRGAAAGNIGAVSVGGPFSLVDHTGKAVTEQSYRGKWMLVYFGYTFCPDVCPTELQSVASALDLLGPDADKVVPLFITIDPERDTAAALAEYVKLFDTRLVGLTGSEAQIAAVARAYRVYYAKAATKDSGSYLMDHSSFLYLMGPDGGFRALFHQGMTPEELAKGLRARMAGT
jgi:protein SCO1/2